MQIKNKTQLQVKKEITRDEENKDYLKIVFLKTRAIIIAVQKFAIISRKENSIFYSVYFFTITQALCPPKPKVLLNAAFTVRC